MDNQLNPAIQGITTPMVTHSMTEMRIQMEMVFWMQGRLIRPEGRMQVISIMMGSKIGKKTCHVLLGILLIPTLAE